MNDELRERARVMKRELSRKAVEWTRYKDFECVTSLNDLDEFTQALAGFAEECIKEERKRIAELEKALDYCDKQCSSLHHPKKYQHGDSPECPVEALVNKALRRSAE